MTWVLTKIGNSWIDLILVTAIEPYRATRQIRGRS